MATRDWAVIWDVDGTLVDTAKLHHEAWVLTCARLGKLFTPQDFADTFGRRNPEIIRHLLGEHLTDEEIAQIGADKEDLYRTEAKKGVELLPGVGQLLKGIHQLAVSQGIGTSAPRKNLELILEITASTHFFAAQVAMEDTTRGKPDPEVFLKAAAQLNIPPQRCIVLEDAIAGVQAAKAGGMKCIGVTFVGHHPREKLIQAGADHVVHSFEEIDARFIEQLLV
ncbi:MAG: HAD family phosphatase [Zavarzinella sp.]